MLEKPGALKLLAKSVLQDIDDSALALYHEPTPRRHLGASLIGDPCYRKLWYGFRWAKHKVFVPRMYRLFSRGHKEEFRFVEWLEKAGYRVMPMDPATGKQWRISGVGGHFGGSCDGVTYLPDKYEIKEPFLLEFKTNSTGAGFNKLLENGCEIAKPVHYDQQNVYGFALGLTHSIYLNVNKNDDDIHSQVIKLDLSRGKDLFDKAEIVIGAQTAPNRISESPAFMTCKMCDFLGVCHQGLPYDKNCRSCTNAKPVDDGQWFCEKYQNVIPPDFIPIGCEAWEPIK